MKPFDEAQITTYARKIMGFAMNKTQNPSTAEDLSQEIFLQLVSAVRRGTEIDNMDAFVTTVCKYTWSNFLRKNKRHWNYSELEKQTGLVAASDVADRVEQMLMAEKLRKEITYLCQIHRKILLLFYYENKTSKQIAKQLSLREGTVRWHLSECRKELKEALTMKQEYLDSIPVKLWIGHNGKPGESDIFNLCGNLLVQNLLWACYGKPQKLADISRQLNVAAAYLEQHVEQLTGQDYLKRTRDGFQTNFYIETQQDQIENTKFSFRHIAPCSEKLLETASSRLDDIRNIHFLGSDVKSDCEILWMTMNMAAQELTWQLAEEYLERNNIHCPIRSDGGEYWIAAGISGQWPAGTPEELCRFSEMAQCRGYRWQDSELAEMIVSENYFNRARVPSFRDMNSAIIDDIVKVHEIIKTGKTPDRFEKLIVARLADLSYAKVVNGRPELLILYFTHDEYAAFRKILEEIKLPLRSLWQETFTSCTNDRLARIPAFLPDKMKRYYALNTTMGFAALGWLIFHEKLAVPDEEQGKSMCALVYEK